MLALSAKVGQKIRIGDGWITVVEILGQKSVRLGFDFPKDIPIVRDDARRQERRRDPGDDKGEKS